MEEKILTILLDMQVDIKDLKKRVINIEENEIPSIRASIKNIAKKEIPGIKKSIKNIASSVYNIENNELPAIRQQRLIDSNNIAKILNNQTNLIQTLKKRNFKYISNL